MKIENRIKKKEIFADSIFRKPSQFERVENEIVFQNQKNLNSNIAHVFQRANPAPRRRDRSRGSERAKNENDRNDRDDRSKKGKKNKKSEETVASQQNEIIREDAS